MMLEALQRHKTVLFVLGLLLLLLLLWIIVSRQNEVKIPSRGVFVMENVWDGVL